METRLLLSISLEELTLLIRDSLRLELQNSIDKLKELKKDEETLLQINDVQKYFSVSKVTIHQWKKKGLLPYHRINRKVYFKKSDVLDSLKQIKRKSF